MGNCVGGIYLPDDLLSLEGSILDIEHDGNLSVILHVLPVVDVKLGYFAVHFAQVRTSFLVYSENSVFNGKI